MKSPNGNFTRLLRRRSRNGQALLIVAFAFTLLVAFAGIAVDVGLLLVRYTALQRSVDAAAIAAAGQIREGVTYESLVAIAQQFINLQGNVQAENVKVDTCETALHELKTKKVRDGESANQDFLQNVLNDPLHPDHRNAAELCRKDPQKLVRVSAQIISETSFLRVLGFTNVTLESSSISQTAVLDVALVIDTSISMAGDTFNKQRATDAGGALIYPTSTVSNLVSDGNIVSVDNNQEALRNFQEFRNLGLQPHSTDMLQAGESTSTASYRQRGLNGSNQPAIRGECWAPPYEDWRTRLTSSSYTTTAANYAWGGCCNDPTTQTLPAAGISAEDISNWYVYDDSSQTESVIQTKGFRSTQAGDNIAVQAAQVISGAADGNFSDLVCEPFKQVRDAARRFIKRLDYVRGDRLYLVSFNNTATLYKVQAERVGQPGVFDEVAAITNEYTGIDLLNRNVGVSIAPTGWQHPSHSCLPQMPGNFANPLKTVNYWTQAQCSDTNTGEGIFAARAALLDPATIRREAVWVMVLLSDGYPNRTPSYERILAGQGGTATGFSPQNWLNARSDVRGNMSDGFVFSAPRDENGNGSYEDELDAYCVDATDDACLVDVMDPACRYGKEPQYCGLWNNRGPNWGLGTDAAGNQLVNGSLFASSFGYCPWYTFCKSSYDGRPNTGIALPSAVCNANDNRPAWWIEFYQSQGLPVPPATEPIAPFCADWTPDTRHFCTDDTGRFLVDETNPTRCSPFYDADDFARDQADLAGLINYSENARGAFIAMFAIYFEQKSNNTVIGQNLSSIMFMRYVADAGDNGQIDNYVQKWYRLARPFRPGVENYGGILQSGGGIATTTDDSGAIRLKFPPNNNPIWQNLTIGSEVYNFAANAPDPCSRYDTQYPRGYVDYVNLDYPQYRGDDALYEEVMRESCGQFWYARDITAVNDAFVEIAGRLFTRLSR